MRILHVIPYMHPRAGGPPVVVENLVRQMNARGQASEIVSSTAYCEGDEEGLSRRLNALVPTSLLPEPSMPPFGGLNRERKWLRERIAVADVVHVHTLWSRFNSIVRRECERLGRPYVLMPHGMLDPYSLRVKRLKKALYLRLVEQRNIKSAARIVYTTDEEAQLASRALRSMPKAAVIPLGGDAPYGDAGELSAKFLDLYPAARDRRRLLFLGRLHHKKGLDRILSALPAIVKNCPRALLTIVGDGEETFVTRLERTIRELRMDDFVLLTGRLEGAAKWGAYAAAELFMLPSRQENFAIAVAEAMQMGVPVVVSDKVNTWPYVRESGGGLVLREAAIESDLVAAVSQLLRDEDLRCSMARRGQRFAASHLTWERAANDLLQCYDEVVRGRLSRGGARN
jgi:glycosyltransferase involved in cell wall biosynthesis